MTTAELLSLMEQAFLDGDSEARERLAREAIIEGLNQLAQRLDDKVKPAAYPVKDLVLRRERGRTAAFRNPRGDYVCLWTEGDNDMNNGLAFRSYDELQAFIDGLMAGCDAFDHQVDVCYSIEEWQEASECNKCGRFPYECDCPVEDEDDTID